MVRSEGGRICRDFKSLSQSPGPNGSHQRAFQLWVRSSIRCSKKPVGHRTLVFSLEVFKFLLRSEQAFRQIAAFLLVEITTEFALVGMMFELAVYWRQGTRTASLLDSHTSAFRFQK